MTYLAHKSQYRLVLEIALFVAVVIADAYGLVPLTQTTFLLPLVWLLLRLNRDRWATIGFVRPKNFALAILAGAVAGVLMDWRGFDE